LPDEQLIHNLEHGGIWISFKPDVDAETKAKIVDLAAQYSQSVVVTPRADNPHPIEVASWRRLLDLDVFNRDQILDFIKRNKNQSPEPLAQ
jgi:alpha-galactosidase